MSKSLEYYSKNQKKIGTIVVILFIILFIMPFITTKRTKLDFSYTTKEDVALYIMQHHELPPNFITKGGRDYMERKDKDIAGYIIGGDTHVNIGKLSKFGISDTQTLKECDIITSEYFIEDGPNKRGTHRLVYTCNTENVRVFYTSDHYKTFEEIKKFELQLTRNVFWIIFGCYSFAVTTFYIGMAVAKKKYNE